MSEPRPLRDRLMDDLRFGPMTHYMLGWPEAQRQMLVESVADDLIRSGYTLSVPRFTGIPPRSDHVQPVIPAKNDATR